MKKITITLKNEKTFYGACDDDKTNSFLNRISSSGSDFVRFYNVSESGDEKENPEKFDILVRCTDIDCITIRTIRDI